jgi:hypothetical protein
MEYWRQWGGPTLEPNVPAAEADALEEYVQQRLAAIDFIIRLREPN